jgi:hypothetical protein
MSSEQSFGPAEPPPTPRTGIADSGHLVHFYEADEPFLDAVSRFVGAGIEAGGAAIVIATPGHREGIEARLGARGVDLAAARQGRQYVPLDAAATLAEILRDGWPDERRFLEVVGGLVAEAIARRPAVRVFGEMVALLWADGRAEAALRLEALWNGLGRRHAFSLLCAYPMRGFDRAEHRERFLETCGAHARVTPADSAPVPSTRTSGCGSWPSSSRPRARSRPRSPTADGPSRSCASGTGSWRTSSRARWRA